VSPLQAQPSPLFSERPVSPHSPGARPGPGPGAGAGAGSAEEPQMAARHPFPLSFASLSSLAPSAHSSPARPTPSTSAPGAADDDKKDAWRGLALGLGATVAVTAPAAAAAAAGAGAGGSMATLPPQTLSFAPPGQPPQPPQPPQGTQYQHQHQQRPVDNYSFLDWLCAPEQRPTQVHPLPRRPRAPI